jgi:GNAT superfamily N-acetyltransferase
LTTLPLGLRLAEPSDLEACAEIYLTAAPIAFPWLPSDAIRREQFEAAVQEEVWVAETGGTIAGFVSIYLPERFIHSLYVHPARHRQGIGQALLDLALRRCGGRAELKCQEGNRGACAFYTRLGWRPVDWGWSTAGPWIRFRR